MGDPGRQARSHHKTPLKTTFFVFCLNTCSRNSVRGVSSGNAYGTLTDIQVAAVR